MEAKSFFLTTFFPLFLLFLFSGTSALNCSSELALEMVVGKVLEDFFCDVNKDGKITASDSLLLRIKEERQKENETFNLLLNRMQNFNLSLNTPEVLKPIVNSKILLKLSGMYQNFTVALEIEGEKLKFLKKEEVQEDFYVDVPLALVEALLSGEAGREEVVRGLFSGKIRVHPRGLLNTLKFRAFSLGLKTLNMPRVSQLAG